MEWTESQTFHSTVAAAPSAMAMAMALILLLSAAAPMACAASVEHTFIVNQTKMTHLCKETLVTVVNGQFPGPTIEVTEGDLVTVHVINKSPHNVTIHWHGVKQRLNCWADGAPMITQCPILPNQNFTYRFHVSGQEGTLWWHAHVSCLRGTLHGAFIIRPRQGPDSYPFPKPDREFPIVIGEWWEMDLDQLHRDFRHGGGFSYDHPSASAINGKLGDLFNCSGAVEEGYNLDVQPGKTYLLRVINAALLAEYYLKIAGHKFTVVAADANYVSPYTTDVIAVAPGETVDALLVADAAPGRYYMVAKPIQSPLPSPQLPIYVARGTVQYRYNHGHSDGRFSGTIRSGMELYNNIIHDQSSNPTSGGKGLPFPSSGTPLEPEMPGDCDATTSFYFHGNLTSLRNSVHHTVPAQADEHMFITLGGGSVCLHGRQSCKRRNSGEANNVATMNNVSFELPSSMMVPMLNAYYYNTSDTNMLDELPDRPPRLFNFTDPALVPSGPKEEPLEPTSKGTVVRRFRHGRVVDVVFQSTSLLQNDGNPMHLHGHDMFVLAQGLGNYNGARDVHRYNLVNPPIKNTVNVPMFGWSAIRFVADNPGMWFMHCHFEFHFTMGMAAVFIVEDGTSAETSLPPPPADFPMYCHAGNPTVDDKFYLQAK